MLHIWISSLLISSNRYVGGLYTGLMALATKFESSQIKVILVTIPKGEQIPTPPANTTPTLGPTERNAFRLLLEEYQHLE
jgi:hypothetical protein